MVYGIKELQDFNKRIENEFGKQVHYFELEKANGGTSFKVHASVTAMMDSLAQHPQCIAGKTALGDLLKVVRKRLLVVELGPPPTGNGSTHQVGTNSQFPSRANSETLKKELDDIVQKGNQNGFYWLKGESSDDAPDLCTPQVVSPSPNPQGFLTVGRRHSSGSAQGQLTTYRSSLFVPILTESLGVG